MVDYPNNPPAGASGGGITYTSDPRLTATAPDYAATLSGLRSMAAAQGGSGSSSAPAPAAVTSASTAAPAPADTSSKALPHDIDLGYRAPTEADKPPASGGLTVMQKNIAATPFHALPAEWQGRLQDVFGPEATTKYDALRSQIVASPAFQMARDFSGAGHGSPAARGGGAGAGAVGPGRFDEPFSGGRQDLLPDQEQISRGGTISGPFIRGSDAYARAQAEGPGGGGVAPAPPSADPRVGGTEIPPRGGAMPPPASTFTPHVPGRFEGAPFQQMPSGGGLTSSELTATDAFGQAQAEGAGVVGGPPGGAPPAPGGPPNPPAPPGRMGEGNVGPGSSITVMPGDNLWTIARDYLGNSKLAKDIAGLNGIRHPSMIHPGMVLRLPGGLDPANVATPRMRPGAPTTAGPPQPAPPPPAPPGAGLMLPAPGGIDRGPVAGDWGQTTGGSLGQGQFDELDDLTQAAAVRAHEMLSGDTSDHLDEYPFHPGGGDVGAPSPVRPSPAASGEPLTHTGGPGTGRYAAPPAAVIREPGYQRSLEMQPAVDRAAQERARSLQPYRDPGMEPDRMDRMRQELERMRGQRVSALSGNDNGLPGVPAMTNPGRPLPTPLQPNVMPDYLRGQRPLPVGRPANQAALGDILQARQHRFGLPESIRRQLELEGYA